ncbi:MAG TPA: hypothetical protein VEW48_23675 [Thermoanaerobaculia bacterium]|nr:hypothetical protein [Thermoanaerobaculia bacterium]
MSRLFLVLLLAACSQAPARHQPAATALFFETVVQRSLPGQSGPTRREVFRDESAWRAAWATLREGSNLPEEPPAVNFAHQMVILAAMETQSCVSRVTIRSVTRTAGALLVDILEAPPAPNCVCITSERPIHVIRLERVDLPARFEVERGVTNCG